MSTEAAKIKSKEVCRILYFDARGRFTRDPKKAVRTTALAHKPKTKNRGRLVRKAGEWLDLGTSAGGQGQARAIITRRGSVIGVRIFDPYLTAERRQAKSKNDQATLEAIRQYEHDLARMVAAEQFQRAREQHARKVAQILEDAHRRDLSSKGGKRTASRNARVKELQVGLKNKTQAQLLTMLQRDAKRDRELERAIRAELKIRGINVESRKRKRRTA